MDEAFEAALAELGTALQPLYDQLATITRPARVSDGAGGKTTTIATIASSIPCMVQPSGFTREERELGAAITASKLWSISMPLGAAATWSLLPQDTITVAGRAYQVQNANLGESQAIELIATCVRLDPQTAPATMSALLLEDGSRLLLEDGSLLLLEA